jgi:hypothetical protein
MTTPLNERRIANAIRVLAMDAVQQANSGHPGAPMGMADIADVVWREFLNHNPSNPQWANRDRFVLSNGHGSMLQYALLHLTGYELSIEDLKQFRQLHSKTPGHPAMIIQALQNIAVAHFCADKRHLRFFQRNFQRHVAHHRAHNTRRLVAGLRRQNIQDMVTRHLLTVFIHHNHAVSIAIKGNAYICLVLQYGFLQIFRVR